MPDERRLLHLVPAPADAPPAEPPRPLPADDWAGAPLRSTLRFLALPVLPALLGALNVELPGPLLYGLALAYGAALALRAARDPEVLVAVLTLYIPLNRLWVMPIAPGLNATNLLLMAGAAAALWGPGSAVPRTPSRMVRPVLAWMVLSGLSFVTTALSVGPEALLDLTEPIKGWLDTFTLFFVVLALTRDRPRALRLVVYVMAGTLAGMSLGFLEWLDKRDLSSIEKARLLGPQLQPNDFAAFMVYGCGPFIGLLACGWQQWRTWPVVLYLLVMARLLLATFSRGGYIGLAAAMAAASFVRGKLFIAALAALLLGVVATVPEVVPQSLSARMGTIPNDPDAQLDKSSRTRLILWHAALEMTWESPLTGKGFGRFPQLKAFYTEEPVEEKDNHNMFLYIASQMGIPALLAFCFVVWRMLRAGMHVFRRETALFPRSVGLGGVALAAAVVGVNMFGSRMTDVCVMAYVWIYLAALARLEVDGPGDDHGREARP